MASLNKVMLMGNLTRKPELRYTPNGKAVAQFGLAMNHKWRTESGEEREDVTFVDVTVWGKTAENCAEYLDKGRQALVEGRLALEQWDDKQTGQKRQRLKVVAEKVIFIGGAPNGQQSPQGQRQERQPAGAATQQRQDGGGTPDSDYAPQDADSDTPF